MIKYVLTNKFINSKKVFITLFGDKKMNMKTRYLSDLWNAHCEKEYGGELEKAQLINYCLTHEIGDKELLDLRGFQDNGNPKSKQVFKFKELKKKKTFDIYRGQLLSVKRDWGGNDEKRVEMPLGHCWTLDKDMAKFFMNRINNPHILEYNQFDSPEFVTYKATIKGSDNFYYCDDRGEQEVFIFDTECLENIKAEIFKIGEENELQAIS